jgi:SAM-dependent methyltransferase
MGSAEVQGELWGAYPQMWADSQEVQMRSLYEATLGALEPLIGRQLLDAGCGSGLAVRLAADRGASVFGLDASSGLIEVARSRTPEADLRTGEIEELPYEDASFDVVTAFNAVQYTADRTAAMVELARVCRSDGKVAIGAWGDRSRCETEVVFDRLRELAPPAPGAPARPPISDPGVVEGLLEAAGLNVLGGSEVPLSFAYQDHDHAWDAWRAVGPIQRVIAVTGADAVRQMLHDVVEADRKPDGQLRQDNVFRYVIAQKV